MPEIQPRSSTSPRARHRARRASTQREPLAALPPLLVVLGFFVLLSLMRGEEPSAMAGFQRPLELIGWTLLSLLASLHHPLGGATLGLGTLTLAPMAERLGMAPALSSAVLTFLLASALHRLGRQPMGRPRAQLAAAWQGVATAFGALTPVAGATLAALAALHFWPRPSPAPGLGLAAHSLLPPLFYLLAFVGLDLANLALRRRPPSFSFALSQMPRRSFSLGLDVTGWLLGALLTSIAGVPGVGWLPVTAVFVAFALLSAEAARNAALRGASDLRLGSLERLQEAHVRILAETSEMGEIAQQILVECRNVLPVQWFQLEAIPPEEDSHRPPEEGPVSSWWAGPEAVIAEGAPHPPDRPRALPGVHRRAEWKIIEHPLEAEGEALAVVRLWCDPRRIEPGSEDLLTSLVPQMASSIHRARLDREAKLDPLTGVPVRRILERRLQRAYRDSREHGRSMAVILCDIDFFKKVNDTYGHDAGDQALIAFAQALEGAKREGDLCCRYGGEEFTLLLEETDGRSALQLAERLRRAVEALRFVYDDQPIPLAMSAGVAAFPELHVKTAGELQLLADEALYQAKEQGRNRCLLNLGRNRYLTIEEGPDTEPPGLGDTKAPRIFH